MQANLKNPQIDYCCLLQFGYLMSDWFFPLNTITFYKQLLSSRLTEFQSKAIPETLNLTRYNLTLVFQCI